MSGAPTTRSPCAQAVDELCALGLIEREDVVDTTVLRVPKAYPAYFGTYDRFGEIRAELDRIPNLYLIGRNGMHRYNNQDHSMLTAMVAVENIAAGSDRKDNIWSVNVEQEYHETKDRDERLELLTGPDGRACSGGSGVVTSAPAEESAAGASRMGGPRGGVGGPRGDDRVASGRCRTLVLSSGPP